MQDTKVFDELYAALNAQQREAVDVIEGPVMVIAGPGTGKTQILTLRIANIMRLSDVPASAILALTFTNAAAANMRKRLVSIVGSEAYNVSIFTFHSFANHLIDRYPEFFATIAGFSNASEVEQLDIIRSLLEREGYELLAPIADRYKNAYDIRKAISDLKKEGFSPEDFSAWVGKERRVFEARDDLYHEKGPHKGKMKGEHERTKRSLEKNEELARLFAGYGEALKGRKRFDFDDSLLAVIRALQHHENFLRELQEEYQYFLVDEHQDTNGAQNEMLELLVSYFDSPNLFVVGDEKQAIFRFQGASLANFLYFEKKFSGVKRINLTTNYRSTQSILDSAHSLISHASDIISPELIAHHKPHGGTREPIQVYAFAAEEEEMLYLADAVKKKIAEGAPAHEIAVLFRTNRDAGPISEYFERLGIPFVIESGHGVLDDPDIRKLHLLLRALHDLTDNDTLAKVLFIDFLGLRIEDAYGLLQAARRRKRPLVTVMGEQIAFHDKKAVVRLREELLAWSHLAKNESFPRFFETVVRDSGLLAHIQKSHFHVEKFDKLVRLFDELKAHTTRQPFFGLEEYLAFLTILEDHGLVLEAKSRQVPDAVRLMTAHKAKGLEFDYVFITGAYDTHWGNRRSVAGFRLPQGKNKEAALGNENDDERRLFYVALTRARKQAYVSYALRSADGRERVPSQFLEEIRPELKQEYTGEDVGVAGKRPPLFVPREERQGREKYAAFVRKQFDERGVSATALNNYLTCPWKWFYRNFFYTQFVPGLHQMRGIAVHAALQDFFNKRNVDAGANLAFLLERLAHHLGRQELDEREYNALLKQETEALTGYYHTYKATWTKKTVNELFIRGVQIGDTVARSRAGGAVKLTGMLDKLELAEDDPGRRGPVSVVDYKTGKPKSRNHIEGKTKSIGAGDYYRQLVFYKLLLDHYRDGHFRMEEGVIDFVEPTERGAYKREVFTIENDETRALTEEIMRVAENIRTLAFWDTRCNDPKCEECTLRELMV